MISNRCAGLRWRWVSLRTAGRTLWTKPVIWTWAMARRRSFDAAARPFAEKAPSMKRRTSALRLLRLALPLLLFAPTQLRAGDAELSQLWQLYTRGDFLGLREQLPPPSAQDSPQMKFLRAAMLSALHREDES